MSVTIREFRREDRDQLTWLVNLHVAAVIPGIALSTNVVLSQLEREPLETIVDPWVAERVCLVAVQRETVVGASLWLRYRSQEEWGSISAPRPRSAGSWSSPGRPTPADDSSIPRSS